MAGFDANTNLFFGNAVANLVASPSNGWRFLGWSGDTEGTNSSKRIVMTRDKSVQAVFGANATTSTSGNGNLLLNPSGGLYPYGTRLRLTAVPQAGHYFSQWGNALSGNRNPVFYSVTNGNVTISASFNSLPVGRAALSIVINGAGNVLINPMTNLYTIGATVTLEALPEVGQLFTGWSGDAGGTSNLLAITLTESKVIMANFTQKPSFGIQPLFNANQPGSLEFAFAGQLNARYRIDVTTNLIDWQILGSLTNIFGTFRFTDPTVENVNHRFYRAAQIP